MDASLCEQSWRQFSDPHGLFTVEVPASWDVDQTDGTFTHGHQGRRWLGRRHLTTLQPPGDQNGEHQLWVTIRVEQYGETPPPITKDFPEPTSLRFLRAYRVAPDAEWLTCVVGHVRVQFQYAIQGVATAYVPAGRTSPAALSPEERERRLALVQHIIDSFDLFAFD